jgi:hypothetical protein
MCGNPLEPGHLKDGAMRCLGLISHCLIAIALVLRALAAKHVRDNETSSCYCVVGNSSSNCAASCHGECLSCYAVIVCWFALCSALRSALPALSFFVWILRFPFAACSLPLSHACLLAAQHKQGHVAFRVATHHTRAIGMRWQQVDCCWCVF